MTLIFLQTVNVALQNRKYFKIKLNYKNKMKEHEGILK